MLRHSSSTLLFQSRRYSSHTPKLSNVGFWEYFGEIFNTGVCGMQSCIESIHYTTGLPWWGTIIAGSFSLRLLLLPARLHVQRQTLILQKVNADMVYDIPKLQASLRRRVEEGKVKVEQVKGVLKVEAGREWVGKMRERGTHPFVMLLPMMLNLPAFFTMTAALRRMSAVPWPFSGDILKGDEVPVDGWIDGGLLWFPDLASSSILLATFVCIANVGTIEWLFRQQKEVKKSWKSKIFYYMMHGANGLSFFVLSMLPSAINLFILFNNAFMVLEGVILKHPRILAILQRTIK